MSGKGFDDITSVANQEVLEEFERKKRARSVHVSTDDTEVKTQLRKFGEPICFFGEGPADRRERLKHILAVLGQDTLQKNKKKVKQTNKETENFVWYHEGSISLKYARLWIGEYFKPRAAMRIKNEKEIEETQKFSITSQLQEQFKINRSTSSLYSQIASTEPVSCCRFSPNDQMLATASWNGVCKLWNIADSKETLVLQSHKAKATCVVFHPQATLTQDENSCNLASCAMDGSVKLWNFKSNLPILELKGHAPYRVPNIAFHPSGRFLGACCFDHSWRLWDLEANEEILHQEGHSKEVFDIAFQVDGSLAMTGSLDASGRVWDLRTGKCIMLLEGHLMSIRSVDFSPNGYQMATGSDDNSIKIWDLRQKKCLYPIAAHTNLVSKVKFQPGTGVYLVSSSYDKTAKIWNRPNWTLSCVLSSHDNKVTCVDVSSNDKYIATSTYDKTFKLWSPALI